MKVEIKGFTKTIQRVTVLEDISLTLESGNIYGLRGKNGSGKTMLMRAVSGLIRPTKGEIRINGKKLGKDIDFPESIGVLIESPSFLGAYTGMQNLKMLSLLRGNIKEKEINDMMKMVGLDPADKRQYRKYSLGMKQKLGLANALLGFPDIILLDEPLNALDQNGAENLKNILIMLKNSGKLIMIASHDIEELEYLSDVIYTVKEGKIQEEKL